MGDYYLAVDIGASSGRHILGSLQGGKLVLRRSTALKTVWSKGTVICAGIMKSCSDILKQGSENVHRLGKYQKVWELIHGA